MHSGFCGPWFITFRRARVETRPVADHRQSPRAPSPVRVPRRPFLAGRTGLNVALRNTVRQPHRRALVLVLGRGAGGAAIPIAGICYAAPRPRRSFLRVARSSSPRTRYERSLTALTQGFRRRTRGHDASSTTCTLSNRPRDSASGSLVLLL